MVAFGFWTIGSIGAFFYGEKEEEDGRVGGEPYDCVNCSGYGWIDYGVTNLASTPLNTKNLSRAAGFWCRENKLVCS